MLILAYDWNRYKRYFRLIENSTNIDSNLALVLAFGKNKIYNFKPNPIESKPPDLDHHQSEASAPTLKDTKGAILSLLILKK